MTDREGLACARCQVRLAVDSSRPVQLHVCRRCGGLWLEKQTLAQIDSPAGLGLAETAESASLRATRDPDPPTAPRIQCPVCQTELVRHRVDGVGLEVDACESHGVWFDRDELQSIVWAIRSSGNGNLSAGALLLLGALEVVVGGAVSG